MLVVITTVFSLCLQLLLIFTYHLYELYLSKQRWHAILVSNVHDRSTGIHRMGLGER